MALRVRAGDLAAMFEVYVIAVGLGTLKTALDAGGPWYRSTATFWTYFASFMGGLVLLGVLLVSAIVLARVRPLEDEFLLSSDSGRSAETSKLERSDDGIEELLVSLQRPADQGGRPATEGMATLVQTPRTEAGLAMVAPTDARRHHVRRVFVTLIGPTITTAAFAAIGAALLPASDGILQANFTFNTFVILLLAYGWGGLIAYSAASILVAARGS